MISLKPALLLLLAAVPASAFTVLPHQSQSRARTTVFGYLDDLSNELYSPDANPNVDADSKEATDYDKEKLDRYGPGDFSQFVDFNEFDGGDGQMGVAGDGKAGLDKEWSGAAEMAKSKTMSAKNAWGKSTGYADTLIDQGMEATRAQQMENWRNQREVQREREQHRWMTDEFDNKPDEDWRSLSSFGGEQVTDTDIDQELGQVAPGEITGNIELTGRLNQAAVHEFSLKNPFMGFSDFRARFTGMNSPQDWTVEPTEGSLNGRGDPTQFMVKFRPQNPQLSEGYLVVETEDDKWTYKLIGTASM